MSKLHKKTYGKGILAITGASGAVYGLHLMQELARHCGNLAVIISKSGEEVLRRELGIDFGGTHSTVQRRLRELARAENIHFYENDNLAAPPSSGSAGYSIMVVAPCTMGTLARISQGMSSCLIERAADVMIKEAGKLILLPRETPLSAIHLENMLKLTRLDVGIVPAMPGFYHHPVSIDDMVHFVVGKVLDYAGLDHELYERWSEH